MDKNKEGLPKSKEFRKYLLPILILAGIILGILLAVFMMVGKKEPYSSRDIMYVGFLGELLLNMLECIALPLLVSGLIVAVSSMKLLSARISLQMFIYVVLLKLEAALIGIVLAIIFIPKDYDLEDTVEKSKATEEDNEPIRTGTDSFLDILRNTFPASIIGMTIMHYETVLIPNNKTDNPYEWDVLKGGSMKDGTNLLGVVCYSIIFGVALLKLGQKSDVLLGVFRTLDQLTLLITKWILWISPILTICVIAAEILRINAAEYRLAQLAAFFVTVIVGHIIQCFITYPLIYFSLIWKNPYTIMINCSAAILTAFSTASSLTTFPATIKCLVENSRIRKKVVEYVIPITHAVNKDGSALYFGASIIAVTRLNGIRSDFDLLIKALFIGPAASVAATILPYSNIFCLVMILHVLDLPMYDVGFLLAVDWVLDRTGTVTNVLGDIYLVHLIFAYNFKGHDSHDKESELTGVETGKKVG